jgi:hypothetical protein
MDSEQVQFRDGCCFQSDPFPTATGICGGQPDDAPSVASLSIGFFILNFLPLVPCLIFGRSDQFKKVFSPVTKKFSAGGSTKVSAMSSSKSSAASSAVSSGVGSSAVGSSAE